MNLLRLIAMGFLASAGPPLLAQPYSYIAGQILDSSESAIPGAAIVVTNEDTGVRRTSTSAGDGTYSVAGLESGEYKILVRREGFRSAIRFGVRVAPGQPVRVNFTLPVGSMQETITVRGDASPVNLSDASVGLPVSGDEAERLPLNGRGLLSLLEMAPGTSVTPATRGEPGQFTSNGQRPNTNYFLVDGVSANTGVAAGGAPAQPTGGALPGMSAFGSLDALISLESVRDFRVQTSSSVPEYGRLPGAIVSITSRSGSNEFHGSAYYRFRHELGSANDWFANRAGEPRAPLRLHTPGADLGGPLRRNRAFFYVSYQHISLRQPFTWRTPVPSPAARAQAPAWARQALNLFPVPNGGLLGGDLSEWSGRSDRPSRLHAGSVKLDHAFGSRLTTFARFREAPSFNEFGNTQTNRLELRARSLTLGLNVRPVRGLTFDLRFNTSHAEAQSEWTQLDAKDSPACPLAGIVTHLLHVSEACGYFVRFSIAGVGRIAAGKEGDRRQGQKQILESTSWDLGSHTLRLGADWRRLAPRRIDPTGSLNVIADSLADLADERNLWIYYKALPLSSSAVLDELSVWFQDTWRFTPKTTLTAGLRWEYSPAPLPSTTAYFLNRARGVVVDERRPLWEQNYRNFAPRLGVARQIGSRTVLRAGGGLYFDSSLSVGTDLVNSGPLNISRGASAAHAPFSSLLTYGFVPDLKLPRVGQWNVALDYLAGERDTASLAYIGSLGDHLIRREMGGQGSSELDWVAMATNHGVSQYHALQFQYRRRMGRGIHGLASYTWSHSIDNSSSDSVLYWAGGKLVPELDRGASDFDLRHTFSAALSAGLPRARKRAWRNWNLDAMLYARTGFPINVRTSEYYNGIPMVNAFRPDLVARQSVWIGDAKAPGGRRMNALAFRAAAEGVQGNLGRNAISGFGMSQADVSLHRDFRAGDGRAVEFRIEAYNVFNQASLADPVPLLVSPLFGQSISMLNLMLGTGSPGSGLAPIFQTGGARSMQVVLRLRF